LLLFNSHTMHYFAPIIFLIE